MSLAIRMSNVSKRYRQQIALQDVTLEVPPGGVFALLGENGAGKTTAIRVLLGIFFSLFSSRPLQAAILGIVATSASESALVYLDGNGRLIHTLPVYVNVVPMRLTIAAVMAEIDLGLAMRWLRPLSETRRGGNSVLAKWWSRERENIVAPTATSGRASLAHLT